jgi:hypothetical protein
MSNSFPPPPENRAVYEIMSNNMAEPERPQITTRRLRFACWISKDTHTYLHRYTQTLTI